MSKLNVRFGRERKAITHFKKLGEKYKAEIIESIPENEELSIYHHGEIGMIFAEVLIWLPLEK